MKRPDEEHCRAAYDAFLATSLPKAKRQWIESERPDYYLNLGSKCFAVEVTSVVDSIETARGSTPALTLEATAFRLVEETERLARHRQILRGTYVVVLGPGHGFPYNGKAIQAAALRFVAATFESERSPETPLDGSSREFTIRKVSSEGRQLGTVWCPPAVWAVNAETTLTALLVAALKTKAQLLESERLPVVLLLLDRYHLASPEAWRAAFSNLEVPRPISSVCRVTHDAQVEVLWQRPGA
jgi:hypothetical protein